jgi:peptidoglycan/LPS O-acetylase OafA/YrhL
VTDELSVVEPSHTGHVHRLSALDGLRGVSALIVVIHHGFLASNATFANEYLTNGRRIAGPSAGTIAWWFTRTPLHLIWAGPQAVLVFFVLSGFVLALPAVKRGNAWLDRSYWPRRFVRLYFPVWGALLFAGIIHAVQTRHIEAGATWWLNDHVVVPTFRNGVSTATVVLGQSQAYTSVLWSLQWEIWFSLTLPLTLMVAVFLRDRPKSVAATCALALCAIAIGSSLHDPGHFGMALEYMPVFWLGITAAFHHHRIRKRVSRFPVSAFMVACILITSPFWIRPYNAIPGWTTALATLGATILLVAALDVSWLSRGLSSRPAKRLGSRSFSLYLVHEPIIVACCFALGGHPPMALLLLLVLPLSLIAAEVFWRLVEGPSVSFARWIGDVVFLTPKYKFKRPGRNALVKGSTPRRGTHSPRHKS